jgi:ATP-dependent DNA ligase
MSERHIVVADLGYTPDPPVPRFRTPPASPAWRGSLVVDSRRALEPSTLARMLSHSRPTPSGLHSEWVNEIKHDGYRLMTRRDPVGIRLITRRGSDWTTRFPLVVEAVNQLKVRSCLIDGEVVCCDERGLATFQLLRHRRNNEPQAFLYAFDLLELNGQDLRWEPIEVRKATLASILRKSRPGVRLNEHLEHPEGQCRVSAGLQNGAGGYRLEEARLALSVREVARLA